MRKPKNFHAEPFEYHQEVELRIDTLNNQGDGLGRVDGWVVMVPYALPGERVRVRIWRNKSNYSDGDIVEILEPSPQRVEPRCKLFGVCGGCQYQHLAYEAQLEWKTRQIVELLQRIGGIETEVQPCWPSPQVYGYRSKITPHFRNLKGGVPVEVGFEKAHSRSIVDVPECPIASDAINAALVQERKALLGGAKKFKRGGTLLLRDALGGVLTDNRALGMERVCGRTFEFVAGEFFQNNPHILPDMVGYALDQAQAGRGARFLVDAYCGVGVFGICGSDRFERVFGVEVNSATLELARTNATINGIRNCRFILGSAEAIFDGLEAPASETAVLIDPPRKGCDEVFLRQLFNYAPARIVYVSCGPDTQARDLAQCVAAGYRITRVQPFDLFPQTRHIENVVTLERA